MKPYNRAKTTKSEEVREMFDNIAPAYDRLNHILSMQIDKLWRANVVRRVAKSVAHIEHPQILDVATGTADLALAMARRIPQATIVGVDPSSGMLDVAREKIEQRGLNNSVRVEVQSAEELSFDDEQFDAVTAAFGVRNFGDLDKGVGQMARVTRRGGVVVILEFSTPTNRVFGALYKLYSRHILPRIGALISKDRKAYDYLPASVEEFATRSEVIALMQSKGLAECRAVSQSGGIAQIYIGVKG